MIVAGCDGGRWGGGQVLGRVLLFHSDVGNGVGLFIANL